MFALIAPSLALISGLMWIRREKLKQIADRWQVLYALLSRRFDNDWMNASLETRVLQGLRTRRYANKELVLKLVLSSPIYGILIGQLINAIVESVVWRLVLASLILAADIVFAAIVLPRPILRQSP